jgi:DNA-binding CsgD family transcriptional regulator
LFVTEQTVKDHLRDVFKKMQVHRRSELVAKILGLRDQSDTNSHV